MRIAKALRETKIVATPQPPGIPRSAETRREGTPEMKMEYSQKNLVACDWDKKSHWNAWDGTAAKTYARDEFLAGKAFADSPGKVFVIEAPHLAPRGRRSVSQIYDRLQLRQLEATASRHGVTIMAFPAKQTVRAEHEAKTFIPGKLTRDKQGNQVPVVDKTRDAEAIWRFVIAHSEIPLMYWRVREPEDEALYARRDDARFDMSLRLNEMRPLYDHPDVKRWEVAKPWILARLSPGAQSWIDLTVVYEGKKNERTDVSLRHVMAVWVAVFESDGSLRKNDRQQFQGVRETMALLWMHAFHGRGGTARSNLIHWGLRPAEGGRKTGRDPALRRGFSKATKELVKVMRDYGQAFTA